MPRTHGTTPSVAASSLVATLAVAAALSVFAAPAAARSWSIPHVFETKGSAGLAPYSFDTIVFVTYGDRPGTTGLGATADLYLYDNSGLPMQSQTATEVCNPCSYQVGGAHPRKLSLSIEDLIVAAGDFNTPKLGFALIVVGGDDPDAVAVQGFVVNSHENPGAQSIADMGASEVGGSGAGTRRTFVLPHILEKAGRISNTQYTFDTDIYATYTAGLAGTPAGAGATVDLYLLGAAGGFLNGGGGGPVCAPCSFALDAVTRKQTISLETMIEVAGGFDGASVMTGYGLIEVEGDDAHVNTFSFVVNSHTSAFDLSVFGFTPQEITTAARVAVEPGAAAPARLALAISPNPAQAAGVTLGFELPAAGAIELAIHDVNGREVAKLASGSHAAGPHRMSWNGRDASGAAVPPGVYFARLTDGSGSVASRIVAIR